MEQLVNIEEVLGDAIWLRSLAIALTESESLAADAVQETYLAALEHPPSGERSLRGWLTVVLRNSLKMNRRGESRRGNREVTFEDLKEDVSDNPEALLVRLELQARLADIVLKLREPYRTVVLRHYYAGQSSAQIAGSLQVPAGTVRWRLKRGLELLRSNLDEVAGGRSSWMAAFIPFVPLKMGGTLAGSGVAAAGSKTVASASGTAGIASGTNSIVGAGTSTLLGAGKASFVGLGWAKVAVAAGAIGMATAGATLLDTPSEDPLDAKSLQIGEAHKGSKGDPPEKNAKAQTATLVIDTESEKVEDVVVDSNSELMSRLAEQTHGTEAKRKVTSRRGVPRSVGTSNKRHEVVPDRGEMAAQETKISEQDRQQIIDEMVNLADQGATLNLESSWNDSDFLLP